LYHFSVSWKELPTRLFPWLNLSGIFSVHIPIYNIWNQLHFIYIICRCCCFYALKNAPSDLHFIFILFLWQFVGTRLLQFWFECFTKALVCIYVVYLYETDLSQDNGLWQPRQQRRQHSCRFYEVCFFMFYSWIILCK